jgi:GNAT superfamily N-acetyltransferase
MILRYQEFTGALPADIIEAVAKLRISVFREWPYLYDGSMDYERGYLSRLADEKNAIVVVAFAFDDIVGVSTGMPLEAEHDEFKKPFIKSGHRISDIFYCAESVLRSDMRGHGAGHQFFDRREAHARSLGATQSVFCSVVRPESFTQEVETTSYLEAFWSKRGYAKMLGVTTTYSWKDVDQNSETEKQMQFWIRGL